MSFPLARARTTESATVEASWKFQPFFIPSPASTLDALVLQHTSWLQLPSELLATITRIQQLTGWSFRDIAEIVGTSHTTIGKLANGSVPTSRSQAAADRLAPLLDVLARLSRLIGTGHALIGFLYHDGGQNKRPVDLLRESDWSGALLSALDAANGDRPKRPQSRGPHAKSNATRELL